MKPKKPIAAPVSSNTRIVKHSMSKRFSHFSGISTTPTISSTSAQESLAFNLTTLKLRKQMVEQVEKQGVTNPQVLAALNNIPRHLFVDQSVSGHAYDGIALPIGFGQTISQTYIVGRMISIMLENPYIKVNKVLEIGTGCGYQAAVLSELFLEVHTIERIRGLYELAGKNLTHAPNRLKIHRYYGDGMLGLPHHAPFDGIVLAAAGLSIPESLLLQLRVGGFVVAPKGDEQQRLTVIHRESMYNFKDYELEDVCFVPLLSGTQI